MTRAAAVRRCDGCGAIAEGRVAPRGRVSLPLGWYHLRVFWTTGAARPVSGAVDVCSLACAVEALPKMTAAREDE